MSGIEHPRTQAQHILIKIQKLKQFKHLINKKNIPLVDKGKAREDVEMPNNNLANQKLKMEMCYRGIIFDRF